MPKQETAEPGAIPMTQAHGLLRIILVEPDDHLAADAESIASPEIQFLALPFSAAMKHPVESCDAIVLSIDSPASLDLLAKLCARENAPPVIALAGRGWPGRPLEFVLTLAEIRGASLALTKPIDALELALAAVELVGRRAPKKVRPRLVKDLERRLAS